MNIGDSSKGALSILLSFMCLCCFAQNAMAEKKPNSLAGKIFDVMSATVSKIKEAQWGHRISFKSNSGIFRLKNESKKSREILKRLEESRDQGREVRFKFDVVTLEIIEIP